MDWRNAEVKSEPRVLEPKTYIQRLHRELGYVEGMHCLTDCVTERRELEIAKLRLLGRIDAALHARTHLSPNGGPSISEEGV